MKKILLLALMCWLVLAAVSCGRGSPSREERSRPRVAVTNAAVTLRRSPGASAFIDPQGVLRIDDIPLPQSPENTELLRDYFASMQRLRLQTLGDEVNSGAPGSVAAQPDAQIQAQQEQLLQRIPALQPYAESFKTLRMEHR